MTTANVGAYIGAAALIVAAVIALVPFAVGRWDARRAAKKSSVIFDGYHKPAKMRKWLSSGWAKIIGIIVIVGSALYGYSSWAQHHRPLKPPAAPTIVSLRTSYPIPVVVNEIKLAPLNRVIWPCAFGAKKGYGIPGLSSLPGGPQLKHPYLLLESSWIVLETENQNGAENAAMVFEVGVTNRGSESIAKDWELCLVGSDKKAHLFSAESMLNTVHPELGGEWVSLRDKTQSVPIPHGGYVKGWLLFNIPKEALAQPLAGSIQCRDYLERRSFIFFAP